MNMRMGLAMLAATAISLGACSQTEAVDPNANLTLDEGVGDNADLLAGNNMAATVPAAINFTGGDGSPLGSLTVEDSPAGLMMRLSGSAMPAGPHGLHLHNVGKCEGPTFESAGAHWNPDNKKHGTANPEGPHKGDLPNVEVMADGTLVQTLTVAGVTTADLRDADGTALVVHATADDNMTDPSGNSGDRIACAVVAPAAT
jgi:Cu-Zn family superoxide dismutase